MAIKISGDTVVYDDKVFKIRTGTTSQRPASPEQDTLWYNSELQTPERYDSVDGWQAVGGSVVSDFGDIQYSAVDPGEDWLPLDGSIVLQSSYPTLFSKIGTQYDTWTNTGATTPTTTQSINSFTYGNGLYVYGGNTGILGTSTNAINWTTRTSGTTTNIFSIAYGNGLYVLGGAGVLRSSTNAINWTTRAAGGTINQIIYAGDLFVAAGASLQTSTNAINWTTNSTGSPNPLTGVAYGNGVYVVAGGGGFVAASTDAVSWTVGTSRTTSTINALVYGNGLFLYTRNAGKISTSTDGVVWTVRTSGTTSNITEAVFGDGAFIIEMSSATFRSSTDAISWKTITTGFTPSSPQGLSYANGKFIYYDENTLSGGIIVSQFSYSYNPATEFRLPLYDPQADQYNVSTDIYPYIYTK